MRCMELINGPNLRRFLKLEDGVVTFKWRDYKDKDNNRQKEMKLSADEFIRRFLIHVLPSGFTRIRHYELRLKRELHKLLNCLLIGEGEAVFERAALMYLDWLFCISACPIRKTWFPKKEVTFLIPHSANPPQFSPMELSKVSSCFLGSSFFSPTFDNSLFIMLTI
jgi:hypothetical protein